MKILCVDISPLAGQMQALGHKVLNVRPSLDKNQPLFNLPKYLHEQDFKPDFIIQGESLGERVLLEGLEDLACPKIFWAIDSHLNMHWHQYYARLFNAVLTPHLSLWQALPESVQYPLRHILIRQMARQGQDVAWKPHAKRSYDLAFVGVLNHHRPLRTWLCELIASRWEMETRQGIPFGEMIELYANTRLIPNEAIAFETNYRLLEGASCGAVVLSPSIGPDQNNQFEPDREVLIYHNGAELMEQIEMLLARPELAEKIGRAAWQRVQAEHLPVHRAQFIVDTAIAALKEKQPEELERAKTKAHFYQTAFWLSRVQTKRAITVGQQAAPLPPAPPPGLPQTAEIVAFTLRLWLENGLVDDARKLMQDILIHKLHPKCLELNLAASFGGLKLNDFDLAKQFLYRQQQSMPNANLAPPENIPELCLIWAKLLNKQGRPWQAGFIFEQELHLPSAAMEVLVLAEIRYEEYFKDRHKLIELLELADNTLASSNALAYFRMGYLARLALAKNNDWRVQMDYALFNLLCCRMQEGLFELVEASKKATVAGQEKAFTRLLRAHDPNGAIARAL